MKIYVAGSIIDQDLLRPIGARLWALGHEITGTWLHEHATSLPLNVESFNKKLAIKDIAEVQRADLLILDARKSSGGKNVEWGLALGQFQHKSIWLVGEETNVFHYLADRKFVTWDECIDFLKGDK